MMLSGVKMLALAAKYLEFKTMGNVDGERSL